MADKETEGIKDYLKGASNDAAENSAIVGDMQDRNGRRKVNVRRNGPGLITDAGGETPKGTAIPALTPVRKKATIGKIVSTINRAGATLGPQKVSEIGLGGEGFDSEYKAKKFFQQFKGMSADELETHRHVLGTFAKKASTPEEEEAFYVRAKTMSNRGASKSTEKKAAKGIRETGGITPSTQQAYDSPITGDEDRYKAFPLGESTLGKPATEVTDFFLSGNRGGGQPRKAVSSAGLEHVDNLHNHSSTLDSYADELNIPDNHPIRKHIAEAQDSLGLAYLKHQNGTINSTADLGAAMDIRGRGKAVDLGLENSTQGSISHVRDAAHSLILAARGLAKYSPDFKNRAGGDYIAAKATNELNLYKKKVGDNSGTEILDPANKGRSLFPDHAEDRSLEALENQAGTEYDLTRMRHQRGSRTVAPGAFSGVARKEGTPIVFNQPVGETYEETTKNPKLNAKLGLKADDESFDRTVTKRKEVPVEVRPTATQLTENNNPIAGAGAFTGPMYQQTRMEAPASRYPRPQATEGYIKRQRELQAEADAREAKRREEPSSRPETGSQDRFPTQSPERTQRYLEAWADRAAQVKPIIPAKEGKIGTGETGNKKREVKTYGSVTTEPVKGYVKPDITPEMRAGIDSRVDASNASAHYWTTKRATLGGDKKYKAMVEKNPELRAQHQAEFEASQAYKNPAAYLQAVGKPGRNSEFRRPV